MTRASGLIAFKVDNSKLNQRSAGSRMGHADNHAINERIRRNTKIWSFISNSPKDRIIISIFMILCGNI